MKSLQAFILTFVCSACMLSALHAQAPAQRHRSTAASGKNKSRVPQALQGKRIPPSAEALFLASEEGRSFLLATGHPLGQYAVNRFGAPAKTTAVPEEWLQPVEPASAAVIAAVPPTVVPCGGSSGARFNLELRASAVPQNQASADFLPNRVGPDEDLLVQAANDWRGNLTGIRWDQSVSGYYVHRSTTADCSVQFEGGLPSLTFQGSAYVGIGNPVVAADPERDAFFLADARLGPTGLDNAIGLFRASASTLLNPTACPNGTHTAAQAASCWTVTPPMVVLPTASLGDIPQVAVDERATNAGKGAGDVYVLAEGTDPNSSNLLLLVACTNTLNCGSLVSLANSTQAAGFNSMHVRSDGVITISFASINSDGSDDIFFVTCTPSGAPKAPVCGTRSLVQHVAVPINSSFSILTPLVNFDELMFTYPKQTTRAEAGGKFTTFLVYDDCKSPFQFGNPPSTICLNAEVVLVTSTDNGATWSSPVSVDTAVGHHFYPAIGTDASTGIVNLAYYSAEGDKFNHQVRVFRNQIPLGSTAPGTPRQVTTLLNPIDHTPQGLGMDQSDFFLGVIARGNGVAGQSRLYTSFDSTAVNGSYEARPAPELNNHISLFHY